MRLRLEATGVAGSLRSYLWRLYVATTMRLCGALGPRSNLQGVFISFSFSLRCKNKRKLKMHKILKLWFKGWNPDFPRRPIWWSSLVYWRRDSCCCYSTKTYTRKIILDEDRRLFVCVRKPIPWRGSAGNVCLVYIEIKLFRKFYL